MSVFDLFSGKTRHPLAEPKEVKRICIEIAAREPEGALSEASAWLDALLELDEIKLPLRVDHLRQLDQVTVPKARMLVGDYLKRTANSAGKRGDEARLWEGGLAFWASLAGAYADTLRRYAAPGLDADSQKAVKPALAQMYIRLMRAHAASHKWRQFQYNSATADFWFELGGLYSRALTEDLATRSVEVVTGQGATTVEAEYLKILLLQASSPDKLSAVEIELAERLIEHFLHWFIFTRELRPDNVYWVDLGKSLPPTRLAKLPEPAPTLRFFSGGGALAAIDEMIEQIRKQRRVPAGLSLGSPYDPAVVVRVLEHMAACWSPTPPVRSHTRRRIKAPLAVAHGLNSVQRHLSGGFAVPINPRELDQWESDDVSLGGMSAHIAGGRQDWIGIGTLVAVQPAGGDNWVLGVVRRYLRSDNLQGSVGIETLSKIPRAVSADAGGLQTEAVLLDVPVVGEHARMVLSAAALEDKVALLFELDDKWARFAPRETLMVGPDYVIANFFVQSYS